MAGASVEQQRHVEVVDRLGKVEAFDGAVSPLWAGGIGMTAADILAFNELKRTVEAHRQRKLAPPVAPPSADEVGGMAAAERTSGCVGRAWRLRRGGAAVFRRGRTSSASESWSLGVGRRVG